LIEHQTFSSNFFFILSKDEMNSSCHSLQARIWIPIVKGMREAKWYKSHYFGGWGWTGKDKNLWNYHQRHLKPRPGPEIERYYVWWAVEQNYCKCKHGNRPKGTWGGKKKDCHVEKHSILMESWRVGIVYRIFPSSSDRENFKCIEEPQKLV
jgi:hypothetical protein